MGCFTKRAQAPFSAWLPAAMAAPTPVSSLVHSSTLVTAGIYVMLRYNILFFRSFLVCSVSLVTLFVGGVRACFEKDLKKVVAMSTLSQLGVMLYSLSIGFWKLCFVHMRMHALFKSLLFLRCGSLMAGLGGGQDSRFFGFSFSSVSGVCFLTRVLRLCGFPFSVGFYSKDLIVLEACFGGFSIFVFLRFFLGCLFTVGYRVRLIVLGFLEGPLGDNYLALGDDRFFVFSVMFLWVWASFSGGFFGGTFTGSDCFLVGGFDYCLGLFIICLGVFVVFWGWGSLFFYSIGYLRFISMGGSA